MRLLTELEDRMNGHGKRPVYNAGGIRPERAFARDVMAAHALLQAAKGVESDYADRKEIVDACEVIRLRAAEILAGWLGEDRNGN